MLSVLLDAGPDLDDLDVDGRRGDVRAAGAGEGGRADILRLEVADGAIYTRKTQA